MTTNRETVQNDTYGEIAKDELDEFRANAKTCLTCGMIATIDPEFHTSRYQHAPIVADGSGKLIWSSDRFSWIDYQP